MSKGENRWMRRTTDLPRVLMVANYYPQIGGISGLVESLSAGFIHEGYNVSIHSVGGFLPHVWFKYAGRRLFRYLALIFVARKYDLIHCHGGARLGFLPIFIGAFFASLFRKPLVMTYHSSPDTIPFIKNSLMVKMIIGKFSVITTPFEITATPFRLYGVESIAIPNILDIENWEFKERTRIKPNIVWTRNFYRPELAIEAFFISKEKYPDATLTMCGRAATDTKLKKHKNISGLKLLGYVPRNELPAVLGGTDIYLNTASHDSFGYAVYEAMAMGLAIVSVASPALMSLAGSDTITFSKTDTPESLANALEEVLSNQEQTRQRMQQGREIVERLKWEHLFPLWKKVYDVALQCCDQ